MKSVQKKTHTSDLLDVIKTRYPQLADPSLSMEKHHLVSDIAIEMNLDPITVANALAFYESSNHCRCWIDDSATNSHMLVVTCMDNRKLYLSLADIVRLTPPIHSSPSTIGGE